jgi:general secretion pathway protein B
MSYILDALRRAESERERGNVPGLHAHPVALPAAARALSVRRRAALATAGVVVLSAAATGLWAWRALVTQPTSLEQPAPLDAPLPTVPLAATSVSSAPVARVVAPRLTQTNPEIAQVAKADILVVSTVPMLNELPEDIRGQIPPLVVNGTVYSDNPAQRLLLLNGQVLSQGSLAATDVTLERIGAKHSEFNFRGTRFRLAH